MITLSQETQKSDPGAVQYGNFINYYQFNSAEDRLKLIPSDVWLEKTEISSPNKENTNPYLVLDVGCNSGDLTHLLYNFLSDLIKRPVYILGVDIDEKLIERAKSSYKNNENVRFCSVDVMNDSAFNSIVQEFFTHHGRRSERFDAICCFSITMWIHLNHDDEGLQLFLEKLNNLAELFVVEPQPWKCYQTAERRLKKSGKEFPLFLKLKWRSNVECEIQNHLEVILKRKKIAECEPTKWKRRICFYR